jgi:hypothetical protein
VYVVPLTVKDPEVIVKLTLSLEALLTTKVNEPVESPDFGNIAASAASSSS